MQSFGGFEVIVYSAASDEPSELYSGLSAVGFASRHPAAQADVSARPSDVMVRRCSVDGPVLSGSDFLLRRVETLRRFASHSFQKCGTNKPCRLAATRGLTIKV